MTVSPEITETELQNNQQVLKTIQCWLSLVDPVLYMVEVNGVYDQQTKESILRFKTNTGISPGLPFISKQFWNTLEDKLKEKNAAITQQKNKTSSPDFSNKSSLINNLHAIGIYPLTGADTELKEAMSLCEALFRRIHIIQSPLKDGTHYSLFNEMLDGSFCFSKNTWKKFRNYWCVFYGAPWMGIVAAPPTGIKASENFWCANELSELLKKWGACYLQKLAEKGKSETDIMNNLIRVQYTGKRLGGVIAGRFDFSQVGLNAAIDLSGVEQEYLGLMAKALSESDPAWRIRKKGQGVPVFENIQHVASVATSVLEPDPELWKILQRPVRISGYLDKQKGFTSKLPLQRFSKGMSEQVDLLSAADLERIFSSVRSITPVELLVLLKQLQENNALLPVLQRIWGERENGDIDFIKTIFGLPLSEIEQVKNWQNSLGALFDLEESLSSTVEEFGMSDFAGSIKEKITQTLFN